MALMKMEAQGTLSGRRSTETFGAGRQNCVVMAVAWYQLQTQLQIGVATGTAGMKMIRNMMLMQPCVHSPRQLSTLRAWHVIQLQPQHNLSELVASSAAM